MLPLDGVKVVSIEQAVAAPFASRQLADFGAEVIKIERPGSGDFARSYDEAVHGSSTWFVWLNRSKQSLALDLKQAGAKDVLNRLLAGSDVFLHNLAPGAAERLGLASESLLSRHPRLIICEISGYGSSGPYKNKKAYDLLVQFETGLVSITGMPEAPAKAGISAADIAAGVYAFSGILLALRRRDQTGRGSLVQVSLFDALSEWMLPAGYHAAYGGTEPRRSGAEHASIAPYGAYRCGSGGQVNLGIQNEREWMRFCRLVLQKPELAADERFSSNSKRSHNRQALRQAIEDVFAKLARDEVVIRLNAAGIANAHANSVREFWEHPQHAARNRWRTVDSTGGPFQALIPPIQLDDIEPKMGPVPALGQHTKEILDGLGYTAEEIRALGTDAGA
jgi:crotonobetainyl-CoA:carnitine CoA-transferase CaiB-like acyl-CoA transferase